MLLTDFLCVFFYMPGIKQTAKLVNSTLMELINNVEDNINDTNENEVIKQVSSDNKNL